MLTSYLLSITAGVEHGNSCFLSIKMYRSSTMYMNNVVILVARYIDYLFYLNADLD